MELTIKHLSAYLPYGLKFKVGNIDNGFYTLIDLGIMYIQLISDIEAEEVLIRSIDEKTIKPILVPLSEFKYYTNGLMHRGYLTDDKAISKIIQEIKDGVAPYDIMEMCFEEHIDVFDLIENGLAVAVTDEFNPYK